MYLINIKWYAKIYKLEERIDISKLPKSINNHKVICPDYSEKLNCSIGVILRAEHPKRLNHHKIQNINYDLVVVVYDVESNILIINSTLKQDMVYKSLLDFFGVGNKYNLMPIKKLRQVLHNIKNCSYINN
jgi:hypothetical protein